MREATESDGGTGSSIGEAAAPASSETQLLGLEDALVDCKPEDAEGGGVDTSMGPPAPQQPRRSSRAVHASVKNLMSFAYGGSKERAKKRKQDAHTPCHAAPCPPGVLLLFFSSP